MKKIIFGLLACFITINSWAQEKGLYVFLGGNVGSTKYQYTFNDGESRAGIGYGGGLGIQYFFTYHVGLSLGVEYNVFNTKSFYKNKTFTFKNQRDDLGNLCDISVNLTNWEEKQRTSFIDIPIMVVLQKKFGKEELHGIYFGAGVKFQIPLTSEYGKNSGAVRVSGYYPEWNLPLGDGVHSVDLLNHNYGLNEDRAWVGKNQLKTGLALTGELGFLIGLSRRVDLRLGITADYGLTNIRKGTAPFIAPTDVQQLGEYVADKVSYSGVLNGDQIGSRIAPFAVKGYLGLRIKLGGLKQREEQEEDEYGGKRGCCPDTIIINLKKDTIVINFPGGQAPQTIPNPYYYPPYPPQQGYPQQGYPQQPQQPVDNNPYPAKSTYKPIGAIPAWYVPEEGEDLNDPEQLKQAKARVNQMIDELEESIYFDLDKSTLRQKSIEVLDRKLRLMKKYPDLVISLVGHTCDIGKDGYNDELSFRRSEVARLYLISHGISSRRLIDVPMGKKYPTYPNTTEYYKSLNRRVDFRVAE